MSKIEQNKYTKSRFHTSSAINIQPGEITTPAERFYGEFHRNYVSDLTETLANINLEQFATAVNLLAGTAGKTQILTMGNGGSGAIADHMAHNLNWDASSQLPAGQKLSARCLNVEASEITARGNDRNQAFVFATQLENHAHTGDVIVALSGSGNSDNIVKALDKARDMGITTIFIGPPDSKSAERATLTIPIVSGDQQIVEDSTHVAMHMFIRALKVKLGGLAQEALSVDVASLRTKSSGVETLSNQLGLPTEVSAFIENGFRTALGKLAARKIETAAQLVFDPLRRDALQTTALGNEFTSFTRLVSYADKNVVAKVSFGKTLVEMMQEFAKHGASGLVDVFYLPNTIGEEEFARNEFIHKQLPGLAPEALNFVDGVAFYRYYDGITLDKVESGSSAPFSKIGEKLKIWHDTFSDTSLQNKIEASCKGSFDSVERFRENLSPSAIDNTITRLINNGYLGDAKQATSIGTLLSSAEILHESPINNLEKTTLIHGNFQPDNILISHDREVVFLDNDLHIQSPLFDVAKLSSRLIAMGINGEIPMSIVSQGLKDFTSSYYGSEPIPYEMLAHAIGMDLLGVLSSYSYATKKDLQTMPSTIQHTMSNADNTIEFVSYLINNSHDSIESLLPNASSTKTN